MIHGYARIDNDGKRLLGFHQDAPVFTELAPNHPTYKLVEAKPSEAVDGYSVVKAGDNHGFLWYPHEKEQADAGCAHFNRIFGEFYRCIPLTLGAML